MHSDPRFTCTTPHNRVLCMYVLIQRQIL